MRALRLHASSPGDSGYGVEFPASSPHVIAVGGTSLYSASTARGWTETVWSGSGSGCSKVYAKPSFQKDPLCTLRMDNDVAAVGDPNTGVAVYGPTGRGSGWMVFGGTSVSAQVIGGVYAVKGTAVSYAASLYADPAGLYIDVTSGANGSCGAAPTSAPRPPALTAPPVWAPRTVRALSSDARKATPAACGAEGACALARASRKLRAMRHGQSRAESRPVRGSV